MSVGTIAVLIIVGVLVVSNAVTYLVARKRKRDQEAAQQSIGASKENDEEREEVIKEAEETIKNNEEAISEAEKMKKPELIEKAKRIIEVNNKVLMNAKEYLKKHFPNRY